MDGYDNVHIGGVKNWISAGMRISWDKTKYRSDSSGAIRLRNVRGFVVSENILYQSQGEYAGNQEIEKLFPDAPVGPSYGLLLDGSMYGHVLANTAEYHSVGFHASNSSYVAFRDNKSGQYQGLSDQGTPQYQGFAEAGTNVGNSYVANEVYQLNPIIDYAEYKNISQYSKPTENLVKRVGNQGYTTFNASGSKVIRAACEINATSTALGQEAAMQSNNFGVQAGRYYKLQLLIRMISGQTPTIIVCTSPLHTSRMFFIYRFDRTLSPFLHL